MTELDGVVGFIEATNAEMHYIWHQCKETGRKYEQETGWLKHITTVKVNGKKYDLWVSIFIIRIDGARVACYHPTSRIVDWDLVKKYIKSIAPESAKKNGKLNHTDATNWYNAVHEVNNARKKS